MYKLLCDLALWLLGLACSAHRGAVAYFRVDIETRPTVYAPTPERWDVSDMTTRLLLIHGVVAIMKHNLVKREGATLKVDVYVRRKNQTKGRTAKKIAAICRSVDPSVVYRIMCIK